MGITKEIINKLKDPEQIERPRTKHREFKKKVKIKLDPDKEIDWKVPTYA